MEQNNSNCIILQPVRICIYVCVLYSRWVWLGVLYLLSACIKLEEVVSHSELVTKLSDLENKPQSLELSRQLKLQYWYCSTNRWYISYLFSSECIMGFVYTSSFAISSCSSSISFRAVSSWFCFRRDWPIRAANSRSRSFCKVTQNNTKFIQPVWIKNIYISISKIRGYTIKVLVMNSQLQRRFNCIFW